MKNFLRDEDGYVLALTLIALPAFLALGLIVFDINRGNNAHSDLQAAADALALAAGRELNGGVDAIDRAQVAMANLTNTVSYLGMTNETTRINLVYADAAGNEFTVIFLEDLPASDDTPLTAAFLADNATNNGTDANFVYVHVQSENLDSFFFNPVTRLRPTVPIAAEAVATYRTAACDVTPLFICNPFETAGPGGIDNLQQAHADGQLHGRLIRLLPRGNGTAFPGNFGLLSSAEGNGVNALREMFATGNNNTCYDARVVETQPGRPAAIRTGLNVRFDMYDGPMNSNRNNPAYAPAANVRRGFIAGNGNNWCNAESDTTGTYTIRFPENEDMTPPAGGGPAGALIGSGNWDLNAFWNMHHADRPVPADAEINSRHGMTTLAPGAQMASRYDVYRYEIESSLPAVYPNNLSNDTSVGDPALPGPSGARYRERGLPQCSASAVDTSRENDRRVLFAAVINCLEQEDNAGRIELPVNTFASIFLVAPMLQGGANADDVGVVDIEIVDVTGAGGSGTLDTFVRDEAILVR